MEIVVVPSSASRLSSNTGSIRPLYPVVLMSGMDCNDVVMAAAAANDPVPPKAPRTSSKHSMASATDPPSSRLGLRLACVVHVSID